MNRGLYVYAGVRLGRDALCLHEIFGSGSSRGVRKQ